MERSTTTDAGSTFARRGAAWVEATQLTSSGFRLRIGGPFRGAWMASLSRRLAELHISIDHTHARRQGDELWIAELHLISLSLAHAPDLLSLDYIAFAEQALGLLGSLLGSLAELDLFPLELHIETRASRAYDSLWLAGPGGAPPSAGAALAAEQLLARSRGS